MSPKCYTLQMPAFFVRSLFFISRLCLLFRGPSVCYLAILLDATRQKTFAKANNVQIFRRDIAVNAENSSTSLILRRGLDVVENGIPCPPAHLKNGGNIRNNTRRVEKHRPVDNTYISTVRTREPLRGGRGEEVICCLIADTKCH